jgi:hypothetical protein
MIALLLGAVFFAGCKKDASFTETNPETTSTTEESTGSISALAARSNLIFNLDFEGSNPFDENKVYKQGCCSYSVTQSNSIAREGSSSFRAEVKASDASVSSGYRAELTTGGYNTSGTEVWVGYSSYFQDWNSFGGGEHVVQWHPNNGSGSAELSLQTAANKFDVVRSLNGTNYRQTTGVKTIVSNKWYDFVWHIKWSTGTTGLIELWIDGEKYYSFTGKTMSSTAPYFKLGINRWNMGNSSRVLYYDNLRIGSASATYADVAPEGSAPTTPTTPPTTPTNPPTSNRGPVANAGNPQTITLPTSSVTLQGSGTDADGTITSYLWTRSSGNGGSIVSPNAATTNVSGLSAGTYVYNLRVTDNSGATANSAVTVTVNSATTPPPTGGGSYGTLSFSAGYNSSSEVNTQQGMYNSVSTSQKIEGAGSFRSEVRGDQAAQSAGYRSEMQYNNSSVNPKEGVYEYDVYYENWKAVSGGGHSIQWHPNSSSGSAVLSLQNYGGKFNVVRSLGGTNYMQSGTLMTTQANKWYKMRWEIKWSTGTDGYIRLYIDGSLYYSFTGKTSSGGEYFKVGQNRWSMRSGENTVVYYDNLKVYRK